MAYSDFTLSDVSVIFNLTLTEDKTLFTDVKALQPSSQLRDSLQEGVALASAINTEKAKSELIIAPIMLQIKRIISPLSFFSGIDFNVSPEVGLSGYVDFILSKSSEQYFLKAPVLTLVEAKNENVVKGLGQCLAEMVAAKMFNEKHNNQVNTIYGVVTTGNIWQFLKLEENVAYIDIDKYYINEVDKILGILVSILE